MASKPAASPMKSTCHCGGIAVTAPRLPEYVNECQCTLCRRYGAAWAYYQPAEVKVEMKPGAATKQYIWGDKEISFDFCDQCGCMCYWWPLPGMQEDKMGINTRNVDPEVLRYVERRQKYGYLNLPIRDKDQAHPEDKAVYRSGG